MNPHHPRPLRSPRGHRAPRGRGRRPRRAGAPDGRARRTRRLLGAAGAVLLLPLPVVLGGDGLRDFVDHCAGVLALVSLTCSVGWGLLASDRLLLSPRQRLLAQAAHRTTAVGALAFLLLHLTVKLVLGRTTPLAALVPFGRGLTGSAGLIGLGSLAALLMLVAGLTGALRGAFASPAPVAARWRSVHALAYPAWCAALLHGLHAGRPPAGWVTLLYGLCLLGVLALLGLRAAPPEVRRRAAERFLAALAPQPVEAPAPAAVPPPPTVPPRTPPPVDRWPTAPRAPVPSTPVAEPAVHHGGEPHLRPHPAVEYAPAVDPDGTAGADVSRAVAGGGQ
ncbi:cytochrome b/b6 domain-containing protein [Streptomyces sp. LE64]|uniref:cytochrome b/b6 domain-containing protein n=1 Tax=Streptomyces sp. LE64 TaxID=3448653 RepID=UPI00404279A8